MNTNNEAVMEQLIALITQGNAHATFEKAVDGIPFDLVGAKPDNCPYSIWQLTEHIRIAQHDILEFSIGENYKTLRWPHDYWPAETAPAEQQVWQKCLEQIRNDRDEFISLLTRDDADLYKPFAYGEGQNLLREALLIADHNSYHTGQIILVRKLLHDWD